MRVLCGGEDGVMGVYGGELLPDAHREAVNRLVRIDAVYVYPRQRAIITHSIQERLPLPYGTVVRIRVIMEIGKAGAANEDEYGRMVESALRRLLKADWMQGDREVQEILAGRAGKALTGVSGFYARK